MMKFRENAAIYYLLILGNDFIEIFDRNGVSQGTIALESMKNTLLNYCNIISKFPWE